MSKTQSYAGAQMSQVSFKDAQLIAIQRTSLLGTPKIYTTTGFGPRKTKNMAGVDHFLVFMKTAVKYRSLYIHHPGGLYLQKVL